MNQSIKVLENEKSNLNQQIVKLTAENKKLSETDQTYFNKAVELDKLAKEDQTDENFKNAITAYEIMIGKFPASTLVKEANKNIVILKTWMKGGVLTLKIEEQIKNHKFTEANKTIQEFANLGFNTKYWLKQLDLEKNKPLEISINRLKSKISSMLGTRICITGEYSATYRDSSEIKIGGLSGITINYKGTSMEDYFIDTELSPYKGIKFKVVGKIINGRYNKNIIKAETIEKVK